MAPVWSRPFRLTYDALGRMAEQNRSGSYTQMVYGLSGGKLALMNGQTFAKAFVPLPAGAVAVWGHAQLLPSSGLAGQLARHVRHQPQHRL